MAAEHMDEVRVRGVREPTVGGGLRPGRALPRALAGVAAGGPGGTQGPRGSPGPRGGDAGACNCLACGGYTDVCREVTGARAGREGSWGLGQMVAALQGLAAERGARFWSCAGGPFISLRKHLPGSKGIRRETSCTISFSLRLFVLPKVVNKTSMVPAFLEFSTDIY